MRPNFRLGAFSDVDEDVRVTVRALRESPFLSDSEIRGFVYDVDDGALREIRCCLQQLLEALTGRLVSLAFVEAMGVDGAHYGWLAACDNSPRARASASAAGEARCRSVAAAVGAHVHALEFTAPPSGVLEVRKDDDLTDAHEVVPVDRD